MKNTLFLILLTVCISFFGQSNIISLGVNYKIGSRPDTLNQGVRVYPEATINLNSATNVSKIHLKIINISDNTLVYNVNYGLNNGTIQNNEGLIIFSRNGNTIKITNPNLVPLAVYTYEVLTEDQQGNLSSTFSERH